MVDRTGPGEEREDARAAIRTTARLVSALAASLGNAPRLVETHISYVLLVGSRAYKIKKPLRLDFLDFSTLARRRRACEDELRLNQRTAPELYLRVAPILGTPEAPRLSDGTSPEGGGEVIEYAVEMRRFDPEALFVHRLEQGRVDGPLVDALAERVAAFHASLAPAEAGAGTDGTEGAGGTAVSARRTTAPTPADAGSGVDAADPGGVPALAVARRNLSELLDLGLAPALRKRVEALAAWVDARGRVLAPTLIARAQAGCVRECHGDLHLANVALVDGRPVLFDCLEFDVALRTIDVLDEVAFASMDFLAHGRADLAARFLNAYLEATGDYEGVPCLPFFTVHRALVRAKVAAIRRRQAGPETSVGNRLAADAAATGAVVEQDDEGDEVARLVAVAEAQTAARRPVLVVTCGLSGSGKTTVGAALVEALPALRIRSDVERKRLAGLAATARTDSPIGGGLYDAGLSEQTYARLERLARTLLEGGASVVVDAAFLVRRERARFRALARSLGVRFVIALCEAPIEVLRARVEARHAAGRDASEAGLGVLDHQLGYYEPPEGDERAETLVIATGGGKHAVRTACQAFAAGLSLSDPSTPVRAAR